MTETKIRIRGLNKLDVKEMQNQGIVFEEEAVPKGSHGEVTLFTAIFLMSALSTLAAYLLRKHDHESFEETLEIIHPDGRREVRTIKWNSAKSEAPEADIIRQIQSPSPPQ